MRRILLIVLALTCASCSSTHMYKYVMKDERQSNFRSFHASKDALHASTVEMFLLKKFVIEHEDKEDGLLVGSRYFSKGNKNIVIALQAKFIKKGKDRTSLFLNAVETTEKNYVKDKTRFFLFVVPLPGGGGKEVSTIKESEIIIEDQRFYESLFNVIDERLEDYTMDEEDAADHDEILSKPSVVEKMIGDEQQSENPIE